MLSAVIFDMDGVLVDSEPLWRRAEQQVFAQVGLRLNESLCRRTTGLGLGEVVSYWYHRHPWKLLTVEQVEQELMQRIIMLLNNESRPLAGIPEILEFFRRRGMKIALASSSHYRVIDAVVDKLAIRNYFNVIHSGEEEAYGKPHPAVYLGAVRKLGVKPFECMAFEDSINGLIAAKAARIKAVAIPDPQSWEAPEYGIADLKLPDLAAFTEEHLERLSLY